MLTVYDTLWILHCNNSYLTLFFRKEMNISMSRELIISNFIPLILPSLLGLIYACVCGPCGPCAGPCFLKIVFTFLSSCFDLCVLWVTWPLFKCTDAFYKFFCIWNLTLGSLSELSISVILLLKHGITNNKKGLSRLYLCK